MKNTITCLTCLAMAPVLSHGAAIFYDGFDYAIGSDVTTLSFWTQSATNTGVWSTTAGLSFSNLQTTGGAIQKPDTADQGLIFQDVTNLLTTVQGTTFWASWLVKQEEATGNIHTHFAGNTDSENVNRGFGGAIDGDTLRARINANSDNTTYAATLGSTFLIVSKSTDNASGQDSTTAWMFADSVDVATLTNETALTSNALATVTNPDIIANLGDRIMLNAVTATSATFDEFRIGTDLASVTPVPEPRFYAAVLSLAVLGFVALRRRNR